MTVAHILVFIVGAWLVWFTLQSAVRTVVVPRAESVALTRFIGLGVARLLRLVAGPKRSFAKRDHWLALFAPIVLMLLPLVWVTLVIVGFTGMYWARVHSWHSAFSISGSSLTTLGFAGPPRGYLEVLAFFEAAMGLGIVALLISYLPALYNAFQKREAEVTLLATYAGEPPTGSEMILRHAKLGGLNRLQEVFKRWEILFASLEESHTSNIYLSFFRSPDPARSWITASGCVLDAAALTVACLKIEREPHAELCCQAGASALQRITRGFLALQVSKASPSDTNISITREEFDLVWHQFATFGLPLKQNQDEAWKEFAQNRALYDRSLIELCSIIRPPNASWSSDRARPVKVHLFQPPKWWRNRRADQVL